MTVLVHNSCFLFLIQFTLLTNIQVKFPDISYADLYTLAGVVAIEESGGPTIPFRFGRTDMPDGETSPPDGRLPDADKGSSKPTIAHIRDVFYRMGFSDREIVALLGAHVSFIFLTFYIPTVFAVVCFRYIIFSLMTNDASWYFMPQALGRCHTDASGYWG